MSEQQSSGELPKLEEATRKGYWGADPSPAAQAETREADQTQGGPVVADQDRDPISAERKDTDEHGDPVDVDEATTSRAPAQKAPRQRSDRA